MLRHRFGGCPCEVSESPSEDGTSALIDGAGDTLPSAVTVMAMPPPVSAAPEVFVRVAVLSLHVDGVTFTIGSNKRPEVVVGFIAGMAVPAIGSQPSPEQWYRLTVSALPNRLSST